MLMYSALSARAGTPYFKYYYTFVNIRTIIITHAHSHTCVLTNRREFSLRLSTVTCEIMYESEQPIERRPSGGLKAIGDQLKIIPVDVYAHKIFSRSLKIQV